MNAYRKIINRLDTPFDMSKNRTDEPNAPLPPNVHGDKAFLAKFQISGSFAMNEMSMLIYDRHRSFQLYWRKSEDPREFVEGVKAMQERTKTYRWARRVGDNKLSICFGRAPDIDPMW